jgi:tetratricopeptide (TPR) repeat protein
LDCLTHIFNRLLSLMLTGILTAALPAFPQSHTKKPALIRDTDTAEGKDEAEAAKEKPFNPLEADRSLKIGDYYFKRKNYDAAIQRYMEALEYQPNRFDAYEALGRAYEKQGAPEKALRVYQDFVQKFPDSPRAKEFKEKAAKLEKN